MSVTQVELKSEEQEFDKEKILNLSQAEYDKIVREVMSGDIKSDLAKQLQSKLKDFSSTRQSYDLEKYKFHKRWEEAYSDTQLDDLLLHAVDVGANDVFFTTGSPVRAKLNGAIYTLTGAQELLTTPMMQSIANKICTNVYHNRFTQSHAYNTRYLISRPQPDGTKINKSFRVNNHQISTSTNGGMEITMRVINDYPFVDPTIPREIKDVFRNRNGIILIVGATGTGKSSFLASLIMDKIQDPTCSIRILTLEAPIEFDFSKIVQRQTFVVQSEVPRDILTFALGVEETLRRAPDDLLIGEMRDYETISAGILAAQTGMLVYSTMHVNRVADTIPRIMSTTKDSSAVIKMLDLMRMVCSQDLLKKATGGRIPVREYLIFTKQLMEEIEQELHDPDKIAHVIDKMVFDKGVHFQVHARFLHRNRQITTEEFHRFMKSRNFSIKDDNLAILDKRIKEFQSVGHEMFIFTDENPIEEVTI